MSFALNNGIGHLSRSGRILCFFIIFCSLSAIFLYLHLALLKRQLQHHEFQATSTTLEAYMQRSDAVAADHFTVLSPPPGLDFIRFVKDGNQLLVTEGKSVKFNGLVDLPPAASGSWIDLQSPGEDGSWVVVSTALSSGGFVQGGTDVTSAGIALYTQAVSTSKWIFLLSSLGCLGLSFLLVSLLEQPLRDLENSIASALEQKDFSFPATDNILSPLYRLLEKVFYQNRKLITEMQSSLDNVAHDLRTPMTRLRAVAEYTLQSDSHAVDSYRDALSDCLEESERVLSMLGVMMSVAEAESGTMHLELQTVNTLETLVDVTGLYQYVAEDANITVSCGGEKGLMVEADRTRLSQVWANLLDNAIKYGHESGSVNIYAKRQGDGVLVSFTDDGMGISESEVGRIWDRLYRGDRSRTQQGLGLGLNYVKAVVEAHGGTVLVKSKIHQGACFEVFLPLQAEITE